MTTWSGWALRDRAALLARLASDGVPLSHDVVVCDHVTLSYPATTIPAPVDVVVVGAAADGDIQALVVEVNGRRIRPDGEIYHVTLSRRPDIPDWASKAMLRTALAAEAVTRLGPWSIPTAPILRAS